MICLHCSLIPLHQHNVTNINSLYSRRQNQRIKKQKKVLDLFVWGFPSYQLYFCYLTATVHKSMFPGLSLTSTINQSIILIMAGPSWCYSHNPERQMGKATATSFKDFGLSLPVKVLRDLTKRESVCRRHV